MSAMNGSAFSRGRVLGCALAVVFVVSALLASTAGASPVPIKENYLALGDSLAFGYSQQLFNENEATGDQPTAFEHGYVNLYYNAMKPKALGIGLVNDGCPGETTGSMIGNGPLGQELEAIAGVTGTEEPCEYHRVARTGGYHLPLHHEYGGTKSQLESALETIGTDAYLGKPVTSITLNIGANDELHQIAACERQAAGEVIAKVEAGELPFELEFNGSGEFTGFKKGGADEAEAVKDVKNCIVSHATALFTNIVTNIGAVLDVIRQGGTLGLDGVNYSGPIVFLNSYDPYGNVFGTGELLEGSRNLAATLNGAIETHLEGAFGLCVMNPLNTFNPANKFEPARLQKWTNMANFTIGPNGKANGPDIHPTPEGYAKMKGLMVKACGI